jgi:hypothetical protein
MKKPKNTTVTINSDIKEMLDALKTDSVTYNDLFLYLVSVASPRIETKGLGRAERQLLEWLNLGYDRKISATELRFMSGVHLNGCKEVLELYSVEVEQFNAKFQ